MLRLERELDADAIARLADGARFAPAAAERRRARAARRGRSSTARRPGSPATIRNGSIRISPACSARSAPPRARRWRAARRSICASTRSRPSATRRPPRSPISIREPTRWSPLGLRIALAADAKNPGDPCRAGLHQGPGRGAGRGLAARRAARRRQAGRAGGRSLRRRRRQDAGARRRDGEPRPALRHRPRQAPARADPRRGSSAPARATCRSARRNPWATSSPISHGRIDLVLIDAPCTGTGAWRRNPDAKWRVRPGALDDAAQGAGRGARPRGARWSSRAAASPMSPARCWPRRTASRCALSSRAIRISRSCRRPRRRTRWASAPICSAARC